ncbi:MAG: hypothetical protein A2V70_10380 [Planctomycetes bacterium RBG_13_63_9]|nr:MAG: hypothetical protein A2V70_10380 [Planctomycetes bacterium RBG_13_63_9]
MVRRLLAFRRLLPVLFVLATLVVIGALDPDATPQAQAGGFRKSPDLFYNFYASPGVYGGVPAQLYLCPRPTPPLVGHTYVTYQPLMPHEFLHKHCRCYTRIHPGGGCTKTFVIWQ